MLNELLREWEGENHMSCGDNLSRGVAFPFRPQLDCNITDVSRDDHGRIITCKIAMDDQTLQLVNIYAPNSDPNPKFFLPRLTPFYHPNIMLL